MYSSVLIELLQYKAWADQELMQCLCDNQTQIPSEILKKCVRMMNHIHVVDCIFVAHLSGQSHSHTKTNTDETPEPESLSWAMQETNHKLLTSIHAIHESQMPTRVNFQFTDGDRGSMSPAEMLLHIGVHSTYHRGQVSQMLKDSGVTPPRELLTRQLHAQEPDRRKA
jgi:uncharacterized damage-inducible protein DinB